MKINAHSHSPSAFGFRISDFGFQPLAFALLLLFSITQLHATTDSETFSRGLQYSRNGQFPEAAAAFDKLAVAQPAAGTLVNLGLAEWQRGHAGHAILAWEQAQWIDPFDNRAGANLKFAREVAQVDAPSLKWFESVSTWLSPTAWVWLVGFTLWLAIGLLILPGVFRRRLTGWHQWLAALSFGLFLLSLVANVGVISRTEIGFVLKKNTPLRLTPTHDGEIVSTLAAGEPARQIRTRGSYVFIRTLGGSGWLDRADFGLISPK